jgi:hypothetical protein
VRFATGRGVVPRVCKQDSESRATLGSSAIWMDGWMDGRMLGWMDGLFGWFILVGLLVSK